MTEMIKRKREMNLLELSEAVENNIVSPGLYKAEHNSSNLAYRETLPWQYSKASVEVYENGAIKSVGLFLVHPTHTLFEVGTVEPITHDTVLPTVVTVLKHTNPNRTPTYTVYNANDSSVTQMLNKHNNVNGKIVHRVSMLSDEGELVEVYSGDGVV